MPFGAFTFTPSTLANSSAKQYASPICCPVRQDSKRIFCPFHPLVCRMMAASRRGDMFSSTVPKPTADGDPCSATSKYDFSGATFCTFSFSGSPSGKQEKPFFSFIVLRFTMDFKSSRASARKNQHDRLQLSLPLCGRITGVMPPVVWNARFVLLPHLLQLFGAVL